MPGNLKEIKKEKRNETYIFIGLIKILDIFQKFLFVITYYAFIFSTSKKRAFRSFFVYLLSNPYSASLLFFSSVSAFSSSKYLSRNAYEISEIFVRKINMISDNSGYFSFASFIIGSNNSSFSIMFFRIASGERTPAIVDIL